MILLPAALAAPASVDLELYRPAAGPQLVYGVSSPGFDDPQLSTGLVVHYTHDPLVLDREIGVVSAVVRNRVTGTLFGAWQMHSLVGIDASLPIIGQWGAELPSFAADTAGAGDLRIAGRFGPLHRGPVRGAARVEVALPVGTRDAWMGEAGARVNSGIVGDLQIDRLTVAADLGVTVRTDPVATDEGLRAGTELGLNAGLGWDVWREHARITLAVASRHGFDLEPSNHAAELLAAIEVWPHREWATTLLVGRGVSAGYGAPDVRAGLSLVFTPKPAPDFEDTPDARLPTTTFALEDTPPDEPAADDEGDEKANDGANDGTASDTPRAPRAKVISDEIVILDPVQFERGTAKLLPESLPVLREVAGILNTHAEILQLVIEGHASEEGGYAYNYDLSMSRASAVYRELVEAGVHPDRLACRSVGEVANAVTDLAQQRRVVFHISQWLPPGKAPPTYSAEIVLPWTGTPARMVTPPPPAPPPPPPPAPLFEEDEE